MKPLALSVYCPNDCDRKVRDHIDPEKTPKVIFWDVKNLEIGPPDPYGLVITDDEIDKLFDDLVVDDATD